jgi:hypothetical protein
MSFTTEEKIFKLCIESPIRFNKDLSQLNL